jgi:hypothetical protein
MKELNQLTNKLSALNLQIFRRGLASVRDFLVLNNLTVPRALPKLSGLYIPGLVRNPTAELGKAQRGRLR